MADTILIKPGSLSNSDDCTASRDDVLKGKTAITHDSDDEPKEGTLELTGTAADSQVLSGKSYYNTDAKNKRTGGMANQGAWTNRIGVNGRAVIPAGYHNGGGYVDQAITNRGAWTGTVAMNGRTAVPEGYHSGTGYVNGPAVNSRGDYNGFGNSHGNDAGNQRMWVKVPNGYYNENANVLLSWADIRSMAGLTADKIKKNVSIMGVTGSWEGYSDSPLYLYKSGVWSNLQTTGLTKTYGDGVGKGDGYLELSTFGYSGDENYTLARLNQTVNFANHKYLKMRLAGTISRTNYIGVSTNSVLTNSSFSASIGFSSPGTAILDVSNLSGDYYIYIMYYANNMAANKAYSYLKIYEIYFSTT